MHSGKRLTLQSAVSSQSGSSYDGKIAGLYDLEETLGSGHFAVVKLARHVFTGAKVAVKVVDKTKLDEVSKSHLFQEVRCMKLVQHPNVVRLYEVIDTQTKLYLVLELGDGGDLYDYIMKHEGGLNESLARKYFRQILRAISYCHQLHVVHRDLKPENVVFFEKLDVVKLTDFGFSNKFSPGQKLETFCGSLAYSAPEILLGDSYDAPAIDIWSLGVILYMLVCGQPPFEKANDSETLTMIMDCKYTVPAQVTQDCRKLIASMLVRDPKKRATLEQIAADPWLKEGGNLDCSEYLPLVSRNHLSEEDHTFIMQKIINGNIASKEEIIQSLDQNKYNHITATYFLLAEIILRKRRDERNNRLNPEIFLAHTASVSEPKTLKDELRQSGGNAPASNNVKITPQDFQKVTEKTHDKRNRKCSIVREEEEDESFCDAVTSSNELRPPLTRRESISDGRLNRSVQERSCSVVSGIAPMQNCTNMMSSLNAKLTHKLNAIDDTSRMTYQADSYGVDVASSEVDDVLRGFKSLDIVKFKQLKDLKNPALTHRRTKLNKIRTPSCSSSEASDDDSKTHTKKKINKLVGDTPSRFRMHRRDSHDDSSDSQDQTFSAPAPPDQAGYVFASGSNVNNKGSEQTSSKETNKTENTRKTSSSYKNKRVKVHVGSDKDSQTNKSLLVGNLSRRRIRESQSLDRITEAQEFELRNKCNIVNTNLDLRNSVYNLSSFSVAETKEEYDEEIDFTQLHNRDTKKQESDISIAKASLLLNCSINNIYQLKSIDDIDQFLEAKNLRRTIHITGTKCLVTIKKIRRIGKYFPVINIT